MKVKRIFFLTRIFRSILITLVSSFISSTVLASAIPDAGFMLESIKKNELPPGEGTYSPPVVDETLVPKEKSDHARIKISKFIITSGIYLPLKEIEIQNIKKIVNSAVGQEVSLEDLDELTTMISRYLQKNGYIVGFAYIPAQDVKDGVIEIGILVGRYDKVQIHNTSILADAKIKGIINCLHSGDVIKEDLLNLALLTLSDIPGVSIRSTLVPGSVSGTSDLIIDIADGKRLTGALYIDNHNNSFTGQEHIGISINYKNLSGSGDDITINGAIGSRLTNIGVVYSTPSGDHGERLGLAYSYMDYSLGGKFTDLNATGKAAVINLYDTIPLIRSRTNNLNLRIGYEKKNMRDNQVGSDKSKQSDVFSVGLSGGSYDQFGGGGATNYGITFYRGKLDLLNSADELSAVLGTGGTFNKYTCEVSRQQYINSRLSAMLTFTGQTANKNLDSSEKFFLGGATGVRAYPEGEASGDMGYKITGELRWNFPPKVKSNGEWALIGFVDTGHVRINKTNLPGAGINGRSLSGAGLGISWIKNNECSVRLDYAWKLGSERAVADTDSAGRLWARVIKFF